TLLDPAAEAQVFLRFRFATHDAVPLAVGEDVGTQAMTLADVNGDGRQDLIAVNADDCQVSVLLGDGHGDFTLAQVMDLDECPLAVAVADVSSDSSDGSTAPDGHPDIIVASDAGYPVVLLGDGTGQFSADDTQDLSELVEAFSLAGVAVADFDG